LLRKKREATLNHPSLKRAHGNSLVIISIQKSRQVPGPGQLTQKSKESGAVGRTWKVSFPLGDGKRECDYVAAGQEQGEKEGLLGTVVYKAAANPIYSGGQKKKTGEK